MGKAQRLLIVDDEENIRTLIAKYAKFEGYEVGEASDGIEAIRAAKTGDYDLLIMDIMMPELDGFSACREIRKTSNVPIIMLSARSEEYDKINGFGLGIDDYVVKPFSPKELMLRVEAILRRVKDQNEHAEKNEIVKIGDLVADVTARLVYVRGQRVEMSPREYDLFFYLLKNKNIALSRERLISEVWGYDFYGDDRTLDTHIKLLRKSLGDCAKYIVTLRGMGYRFDSYEES